MLDQPVDRPIPYTVVDMPDTPEAIVFPRPSLEDLRREARVALEAAMMAATFAKWDMATEAEAADVLEDFITAMSALTAAEMEGGR